MNSKKHEQMEKSFVKYKDLLTMLACDQVTDNECFVKIYSNILVRKTVYMALQRADKFIKAQNPNYSLKVVEGWRNLSVQEQKFNEQIARLKPLYSNQDDLIEAAHRLIAVPSVS